MNALEIAKMKKAEEEKKKLDEQKAAESNAKFREKQKKELLKIAQDLLRPFHKHNGITKEKMEIFGGNERIILTKKLNDGDVKKAIAEVTVKWIVGTSEYNKDYGCEEHFGDEYRLEWRVLNKYGHFGTGSFTIPYCEEQKKLAELERDFGEAMAMYV